MRNWRRNDRLNDLDRELRSDLELEIEEQMAQGVTPEEARFAAHRALGNIPLLKDRTCEAWGGLWLELLVKDLRYAIRGLFRSPLFTVVAVLSLALGVCVMSGVFGVFEAVFLHAVSADNPVDLKHLEPGSSDVSYPVYRSLFSASDSAVLGMLAYSESSFSFRSGSEVESVAGDIVSSNFFDVLGVNPAMGRGFSTQDQQPEAHPDVAIVSHTFWKQQLAAKPNILGTAIELNHRPFIVIGILPEGYRSVHGYGMTPAVYLPLSDQLLGNLNDPSLGNLQLIARVQHGVSDSQLAASVEPIIQAWKQLYPRDRRYAGRVAVYPVTGIEKMRRDGVPVELTVFLAFLILTAILLLLIGCANVAGLLIARGINRTREIAVRLALGAARFRLIQQLLIESAVLAFLGVLVGLAFFFTAAKILATIQFQAPVPFELYLRFDTPLVCFSAGLVIITTLLSGLVPALQTSRPRWHLGSNQIGAETHGRAWLSRALVMGQLALAFILLVSATLFLRGLEKSGEVNPGFNTEHLLIVDFTLDANSPQLAHPDLYFQRAIDNLSRLPGVRSVSGATVVPLGIEHDVVSLKAGEQLVQRVFTNGVTPGYFRTMQIAFLQGRDFQADDRGGGVSVGIVNETFAKQYLRNGAINSLVYEPIPGNAPTFAPIRIVGVVSDSKYGTLGEDPMPALYRPESQQQRALSLEINTVGAPANTVASVRQALVSLAPQVSVKITSMKERLSGALLPNKIASMLLTGIGAFGLVLATIGIYGTVAYNVGRRSAEMGIRMALGATRGDVLRLILGGAVKMVCAGLAVGIVLSLFVVQALGKALPAGTNVIDPLNFGAVASLLSAIALIAAFVPARKGSQIDPNAELRLE